MTDFRQDFIRFAAAQRAFSTGATLGRLCEFYVKAIQAAGIKFDALFGSAYKGIPLAAGVAICMARAGHDVPFSFNRKETKDHGEGGTVVGAPLMGRVLIIDDVISAGTSVRESVKIIRDVGAEPCAVAIALDRMERGLGNCSATQEVEQIYGIPVISIVSLEDLVTYLRTERGAGEYLAPVLAYRERYGVADHVR